MIQGNPLGANSIDAISRSWDYLDRMLEPVHINDKQAFLDKHYPFTPVVKLTDVFRCLHCIEVIRVVDFKVYKGSNGFLYICCPNAPECSGTVIDWMPVDMN